MRVRIIDGNDQLRRDVEVTVHDPLATVEDLVEAVSQQPAAVRIDGRTVDLAGRLDRSGLGDGAIVEISRHRGDGEPGPRRPPARPAVLVTVVGGFDVGHRLALGPGPTIVRRDEASAGWGVGRGGVASPGVAGRSTPEWLAIDDPTLGGRHIGLAVGADGSVAVRPLGIGPTVRVDGHPIDTAGAGVPAGAGCLPFGRLAQAVLAPASTPRPTRQPREALPGWEPPPTELSGGRHAEPDPEPRRDDPPVPVPVGSRLACGAATLDVTGDHSPDPTPTPPPPGARTSPIHRIPRRPEPEPVPRSMRRRPPRPRQP